MQDRQPPQVPPAPPAPPAPSDQPNAPTKQPLDSRAHAGDGDTAAAEAGAGQNAQPFDGHPDDAPGTENQPPPEEIGDAPIIPEGDAPITPVPPAAEVALPSIPDINEIPEAVKRACLADGIPEAEFAKDFRLPVEVRERLLRNTAKELTGVRPPQSDSVINAAARITTVGELIAFFEESHPDHPTQSGAGS